MKRILFSILALVTLTCRAAVPDMNFLLHSNATLEHKTLSSPNIAGGTITSDVAVNTNQFIRFKQGSALAITNGFGGVVLDDNDNFPSLFNWNLWSPDYKTVMIKSNLYGGWTATNVNFRGSNNTILGTVNLQLDSPIGQGFYPAAFWMQGSGEIYFRDNLNTWWGIGGATTNRLWAPGNPGNGAGLTNLGNITATATNAIASANGIGTNATIYGLNPRQLTTTTPAQTIVPIIGSTVPAVVGIPTNSGLGGLSWSPGMGINNGSTNAGPGPGSISSTNQIMAQSAIVTNGVTVLSGGTFSGDGQNLTNEGPKALRFSWPSVSTYKTNFICDMQNGMGFHKVVILTNNFTLLYVTNEPGQAEFRLLPGATNRVVAWPAYHNSYGTFSTAYPWNYVVLSNGYVGTLKITASGTETEAVWSASAMQPIMPFIALGGDYGILSTNGTATNGEQVVKWTGQCATTNSFFQTNTDNSPYFSNAVQNGHSALMFTNNANYLSNALDVIGAGNITMCFVFQGRTAVITERLIDNGKFRIQWDGAKLIGSSDGTTTANFGSVVVPNTKYVLFVTRDSSGTMEMFTNGVTTGSPQSTGTPASSSPVYLGNYSGFIRAYDGYLYEFRLYTNILSSTHIYKESKEMQNYWGF